MKLLSIFSSVTVAKLRRPIGLLLSAALASLVFVGSAAAQMASDNSFIGVWKLNVERSVYLPGPRPPSDLVTLYEFAPMADGFVRFTLTSTNQQGSLNIQMSVFKIDGEQRTVFNTGTLARFLATGQESGQTRSYRRIDASSVEFTTYNNGVAGIPQVRTLSPDGQTYVDRVSGTNNQGVAFSRALVFDRVR
jgi:hypothetical protein